MRVVAMLACPSHSWTLAMSASWSGALVAIDDLNLGNTARSGSDS